MRLVHSEIIGKYAGFYRIRMNYEVLPDAALRIVPYEGNSFTPIFSF